MPNLQRRYWPPAELHRHHAREAAGLTVAGRAGPSWLRSTARQTGPGEAARRATRTARGALLETIGAIRAPAGRPTRSRRPIAFTKPPARPTGDAEKPRRPARRSAAFEELFVIARGDSGDSTASQQIAERCGSAKSRPIVDCRRSRKTDAHRARPLIAPCRKPPR